MRRIYHLLVLLSATTCVFSCKNGNEVNISQSSAKLIVGKWTLQQQHFVQYIGAAKYMDTTYTASQNSFSQIQFNSDGTFASASKYISNNNNTSLNGNSGATNLESNSGGTYSFTGTDFSISAPIAGFGSDGAAFYGTTATAYAPVIAPISNLAQITLLTSTRLTLHTEYVYSYTVNNVSQTYKTDNDYYYNK
jgi:hypothetical protein